jgi:hypothetical protein
MKPLFALVSLASAAAAPAPLVELHTPRAWLGSSALSLQGPRDPVAMMTTWVYAPEEILAYRPSVNASAPAWTGDTTKDLTYQTLSVESASGRTAALPKGAVDTLAFWNRKPSGIVGECVLIGFDSAAAPDLSFGPPRAGSWHFNLSSDCSNVNGAVPWSRFALSDDGLTAVAWTQGGASPNVTVYALDGQTGRLRWTVETPCGKTPDECDYFLSYGVDVSDDGRWVVFDEGTAGDPHRLHVLSAADGSPRCPPVVSPDAISAHISPDGAWMYTSSDPANPSSGNFSTWRFNPTAARYERAGSGAPPEPAGSHGWTSAEYAFSLDAATNTTLLGVVWFDTTLAGDSILAVYDAAAPQTPKSFFIMKGIDNGFANAGAVVDCSGALCAAGFWTQRVGGPQNTLVALSGRDPHFLFNFTTPGSVDAVSILEDRLGGDGYFLLGVGCQSLGVCTKPGGDAYLFELTP